MPREAPHMFKIYKRLQDLIYSRPPPRTDGFRFDLRTDGRVGLARNFFEHNYK